MVNTQHDDGTWIMPASHDAQEAAGLLTIKEYVQRRVNMFLPFAQSCALYRECQDSQATQAAANHPIWWAAHAPLLALPAPPQPQLNADDPQLAAAAPFPFPAPRRRSPRCEYMVV